MIIREVGLRDGLQLVKRYPTTAQKTEWIEIEQGAGLRHFEVGSYLPVTTAPQFADVDYVVAAVKRHADSYAAVLTLNPKGFQHALAGDADEIVTVISASEEHNRANIRRSRGQSLVELKEAVALRDASGRDAIVTVGIAMSFGCSISGDVPMQEVLSIAEQSLEAGADILLIADTVGYGGPSDVTALVKQLTPMLGHVPLGFHFHDTRGLGLANAAAALDAGVRILDASLAGLGGCPFAPNATGNIVLEDVIFLAQKMGFDVPVDLTRLVQARAILEAAMPDEPLYGGIARAGLPLTTARAA
ncbi:hydroxymethylglutaryl-CoA lyase [Sphingobium sp.]|uniref:hydroxymethylglutaryl-CoA lyase n=1 Tax=Sphingobium sp. TaxID=1912891 RepID=UPI002B6AACA1|nr:hydroxymethylglutaryl-CoA lyase [Sphingobium sp.]HUD92921.1 hydroxymethylglutaryl-CoA lyase [Sphingobium sp.]